MPYETAPIQVAVVSVTGSEGVETYCRRITEQLQGIRYTVDLSERSIGVKRYCYENKGIPFRMEIGKREVETETITIVCLRKRYTVTIEVLAEMLRKLIAEYSASLRILSEVRLSNAEHCGAVRRTFICDDPTCSVACRDAGFRSRVILQLSTAETCVVCGRRAIVALIDGMYF